MPASSANLPVPPPSPAGAAVTARGYRGSGRRPDGHRDGMAVGTTAATRGHPSSRRGAETPPYIKPEVRRGAESPAYIEPRSRRGAETPLYIEPRSRRGAETPPYIKPSSGGRGRRGWALVVAAVVAVAAMAPARAQDRTGALSPAAAQVERAMVTLPAPPAWDPHADAGVWTIDDIKAAFARVTDTPPEVDAIHTSFLRPDPRWLGDFRRWFHALQDKLDFHYEEQVWDCDNYANCFVAFADLLTLRAGETRGRLCVGWASVYYETPFAGVGRGAHSVVIVGTRDGLFVIEPQDGTMVPLRQFPNRDTIVAVYF